MSLIRLRLRIDLFFATYGETSAMHIFIAFVALVSSLVAFYGAAVPTLASAAVETVSHFAGTTGDPSEPIEEEVQLGGVGGMAVNYTGAGGVAAGTVYAATSNVVTGVRVAMFTPMVNPVTSELELEFKLSWEVTGTGGAFNRCGPSLPQRCQARPKGGPGRVDVDVDQATGNVYVLNGESFQAGRKQVVLYGPEGEAEITRFGELSPVGSKTSETPEMIHRSGLSGGLAVNDVGEVYVFDVNFFDGPSYRLMKFRPKVPGVFTEYEYAGLAEDVGSGGAVGGNEAPEMPVADAAGNIYVAPAGTRIEMYDPASPVSPPVCSYFFEKGGITAITVDPASGSPYFFSYKPPKRLYQLGPCNPATGKFEGPKGEAIIGETIVTPERDDLWGLAFDPVRQFSPGRPAGVLYGGAPNPVPSSGLGTGEEGKTSLGYIFSAPEENPPAVESESVQHAGEGKGHISAVIDPKGSKTRYIAQYLSDDAYQANEPEERQAVMVTASGGLFGLGLGGARFGGPALGTLSSGSATVTSLRTATATASLKAAKGTGDLNGASGKGMLFSGSKTIPAVSTTKGEFEVGQGISGEGIPQGTTITAVAAEPSLTTKELTISAGATKSLAHAAITSGTKTITSLTSSEGAFEAGQVISGQGIPAGTTILTAAPGELTISKPVVGPATAVALKAGSTKLTSLVGGIGSFEVGSPIQGEGIPANTKVTAVSPGELTLSSPVEKPGSGVAVSSPGPFPLAAEERIEGPGIAPGTTIVSIQAGQLTLSSPATANGSNVSLRAGLPADASAGDLRRALEGLSTIGPRGVEVSGGPGDESGSSPYEVTFTGALENVDVSELSASNLSLSGGPATITTQTLHDGGGGFDEGAAQAPPGGGSLANSTGAQSASVTLTGLAPDTTYHYQVVATSNCSVGEPEKVCEGTGATESFHTYPAEAPGLHDSRAWELVSPAQKNGGQVLPAEPGISSCGAGTECKPGESYEHFPMESAPDGKAVVYEGTSFAPGTGVVQGNEYIARRDPNLGWQTVNLTPALMQQAGRGYKAFDEALSLGLLGQTGLVLNPAAPPDYKNLYAQPSANPLALTPLLTAAAPNRPAAESGFFEMRFADASADLSRIFFEANDVLTAEVPGIAPEPEDGGANKFNIYEWEAATGTLRLVNVFPGNTTTEAGASIGVASANAVSADGSRVFWSDESGQAYVREDAATTEEIPDAGEFLSASTDGSKVLLKNGHIYDLETEATTDLTAGTPGFQGIAGQSEDLSHVYFVDTAALTGKEENSEGARAQAGNFNLYAWAKQGEAPATTRYVATLLASDNNGSNVVGGRTWAPLPSRRSAEASPGGRYLAFLSQAFLTGVDSTGPCFVETPCPEVFLYDSEPSSGQPKLYCASCNHSGAKPLGLSALRLIKNGDALPQPRYLLDSGRLYFDSQDSLSQFDTNDGVEDVYEFEPEGSGGGTATCTRKGGCVTLISSGHDAYDANLLALDGSGANVFFTTRNRLNPADTDALIDLYDAREGGGFGFEAQLPPGPCQGEGCQIPALPTAEVPPSSQLPKEGNPKPRKCKKGQVKKNGKCVKKHKPKKKGGKNKKRAATTKRGGGK